MSRPIKFRAWVINDHFPNGYMWYPDNEELPYVLNMSGDLIYDKHVGDFNHILTWARISCYWKLMQFTGLLDENGKEIYEGDIVRDKQGNGVVVWNASIAGFSVKPSVPCEFATYTFNEGFADRETILTYTEVIGNIHEKPELLK